MAVIQRTRSAQYPLVAEFVFNYNDGMANLSALNGPSVDLNPKSGITDFGSKAQPTGVLSGVSWTANDNASSKYFEVIALPVGAQIVGGDVQVEAPYVGPSTATLALGDINSGTEFLAATTLKAAAMGGTQTGAVSGAHVGQTVTLTVAASHGVVAGNIINVSGVTGNGAACYNGTYLVDAVTATTIVYTCSALAAAGDAANTAATMDTGGAGITFTAGRTALNIPAEITNQSYGGTTISLGQEAAAGMDVRATLTMSGGQAATQGRVRIRVMYTIQGRGMEVINT